MTRFSVSPASSTGSAAWTPMATASYPCTSWSISMRSSVRGWRGWASNPCPSRICSARCWTWSNQRAKVSVSAELLNTFSLSFLSCLDVVYRHWSALPPGKITLGDLKRCRMAHIFFDTFLNLEKYLDHEQRDPFAVQKVGLPPSLTWIISLVYSLKPFKGTIALTHLHL